MTEYIGGIPQTERCLCAHMESVAVHPENLFSRRGFESNGFTPIAEAVKYGGLNRLIYCKVC